MIKKVFKHLLTILIVGLGILNFSSATVLNVKQIGQFIEFYGNYYITVLPGGQFQSIDNTQGIEKNMFIYFPNNNSFQASYFYTLNSSGEIAIYAFRNSNNQGFFSKYSICSELTFGIDSSNLSCSSFDYDTSVVNNFLSTVKSTDYFYSDNVSELYISSHELGYSIKFWNSFIDKSTSLGLSSGNINISSDLLYNSPGYTSGGGSGTGDNSTGFDEGIINSGGVISSTCTNQKAVNFYEKKGFSSRLCYGGYNDFETYTGTLPFYGSGLDVEEIRMELGNVYQGGITGSAMSFDDWFSYRRQMYKLYKLGNLGVNPFNNTPTVLLTYFGAVDLYGGDFNDTAIIDYCNVKLYRVSTNSYNGPYRNNICSVLDLINDQINAGGGGNGTGSDSGTGSIGSGNDENNDVTLGFDVNDIVNGTGNNGTGNNGTGNNGTGSDLGSSVNKCMQMYSGTIIDGMSFIKNYYYCLEENFGDLVSDYFYGILPNYIVLVMCALILFRFLSH